MSRIEFTTYEVTSAPQPKGGTFWSIYLMQTRSGRWLVTDWGQR
jgi:hypothetical protein